MRLKIAKFIGAALGFFFGGWIGAIIGFLIGSVLDSTQVFDEFGNIDRDTFRQTTTSSNFSHTLVLLSASVMRADGRLLKSELEYIRRFFSQQFGQAKTADLMLDLRQALKKDINLQEVCMSVRQNMRFALRLQLLHYLFGIAYADGKIVQAELQVLANIAAMLGVSKADFESIYAMFGGSGTYSSASGQRVEASNAYKILEIKPSATDQEVKKAYRKMAKKHHPDKVSSLGKEYQKAAEDKFQKIQEAYDAIKKERGMS